jgi:SAM-dependent methyltransferase
VDDLLARGYRDITILDVSETAFDVTKKRLGAAAEKLRWIVADITDDRLELDTYDVWHDRAVFHFLTTIEQRAAYVRQVARAVRPGGPHEVQRTRCRALRRRFPARRIRHSLPSRGKLEGTAPNSLRDDPAISLLLLPDRMSAVREVLVVFCRRAKILGSWLAAQRVARQVGQAFELGAAFDFVFSCSSRMLSARGGAAPPPPRNQAELGCD